MSITENVRQLLREVPAHVRIVAAAKTRTPEEVIEALEAGITAIGENYVQEAEAARAIVTKPAAWHCIGHLQKNKVKKAVELFDVIETVDSVELAVEIDKRCAAAGKTMPVLIEINSGREEQKSGVVPEVAEHLVKTIATLENITVTGLMTMGPLSADDATIRACFRETRQLFDHIKELAVPGAAMLHLSMGMTDSYPIAIEEGATAIRIGTRIFGERRQG